uniref:DUF2911 domain-containing protein n=1 Tax=Fulvivirga sp. TaxID=1931237 RepID=UPI00404A33EB
MNVKKLLQGILMAILLSSSTLMAQTIPAASPLAQVMQRVGITDITITYSRPSVNNREIWGKLVRYGSQGPIFSPADFTPLQNSPERPWRTGANNATTIEITHEVTLEGHSIPAGKYALYLFISENNEAEIILSSRWNQLGSFFYDESLDVARFKVKMEDAPHTEQMRFEFNNVTSTSAEVSLMWEKKKIPFNLEVNTVDFVSDQLIADAYTPQTPMWFVNASTYLMNNGSHLDIVEKWAARSANTSTPNFRMLSTYASILALNNQPEKATQTLDKALALSKEAGLGLLNFYGNQALGLKLPDFAIKAYTTIKDTFPNREWIAYLGLTYAYSMKNDYKEAIKQLKKAKPYMPKSYDEAKYNMLLEKLKKGEDIN